MRIKENAGKREMRLFVHVFIYRQRGIESYGENGTAKPFTLASIARGGKSETRETGENTVISLGNESDNQNKCTRFFGKCLFTTRDSFTD